MEIKYHFLVKRDLRQISASNKQIIKNAITNKLSEFPEVFGEPLRRSLKGYRKLRVGDYRVVFKIEQSIVYILTIQHRSIVYKKILKRI